MFKHKFAVFFFYFPHDKKYKAINSIQFPCKTIKLVRIFMGFNDPGKLFFWSNQSIIFIFSIIYIKCTHLLCFIRMNYILVSILNW